MRKFAWGGASAVVFIASLAAFASAAEDDFPMWAFYFPDAEQPPGTLDRDAPRQLADSDRTYTQNEIDDLMNPPDWFPDAHPPMPRVVSNGAENGVFACASCHLVSGMGHPESSSLAGLSVGYQMAQIEDFRSGARSHPLMDENGEPRDNATQWMIANARALTDEDSRAAAEYYASLEPIAGWVQVVESETAPTTYINRGYMRVETPEEGQEPLGNRIIEVAQDPERELMRDPRSGTVAYVPVGSIEKGREWVTNGNGNPAVQCMICHGPDLTGLGDIPGIAGRSPTYTFRQLHGFKDGSRAGTSAVLMNPTVANMNQEDMIAVAAYLATLEP